MRNFCENYFLEVLQHERTLRSQLLPHGGGRFSGSLSNTPAAELGAVVVKAALERAGLKPENVDELMFGCILTAAQGQNVARQASIKAGIPYSVPAYTVGMVCGSGMKSMIEGARSILAGDADVGCLRRH